MRNPLSDSVSDWTDAELVQAHIGYGYGGQAQVDEEFWRRYPVHHGFHNAAEELARQHYERWMKEHGYEDVLGDDSDYQQPEGVKALRAAYQQSVDKLAADLESPGDPKAADQ